MRIAINGNRHQESHLQDIDRLVTSLLRRDDRVMMTDRFLDYLTGCLGERFALGIERVSFNTPPEADLVIAIGGDGAFLKTAAWVKDREIPVAGINTGHLGFLAAFSFDRPDEIEKYLVGLEYTTDQRTVMEVETPGWKHYALNEVAITRGEYASMVQIEMKINGDHSLTYKGDGLIVATPTGSTAYNLSVGGPILDPAVRGWVLSPIAAHSLSIRPMVIDDSAELTLGVELRGPSFLLSLDGKNHVIPCGSEVKVRRAPFHTCIVSIPGHSFTDTLRTKLGLGV